jgi:hypothetical protein
MSARQPVTIPTGDGRQLLVVESYDNFDAPDARRCLKKGEFDTLDAALQCAGAIIDGSLRDSYRRGQSASDWYAQWACFGAGVNVHGAKFDQGEYARARIQQAILSSRKKTTR